MMENSNSPSEAESTQTATVVESPKDASPALDNTAELKGMLAQARNVREMLENFKAACEGSTVSGHVAVRMAIGLQWLDSMLRQNKTDIQNLQTKLEQK